jgi:micrococcal nuclease
MKIIVVWVALLWLLAACQAPVAAKQMVTVNRAISGSTVELTVAGQVQKVRLVGVNAPTFNQKPWGAAAKERLEEIIQESDRKFLLELEPTEPQGASNYRYGYLWRNNTLVNEQLIREGQGLAATQYVLPKYERQLVRAQAYARLMAVGIWSHDAPLRSNPGGK